jgi:hypothetical protein
MTQRDTVEGKAREKRQKGEKKNERCIGGVRLAANGECQGFDISENPRSKSYALPLPNSSRTGCQIFGIISNHIFTPVWHDFCLVVSTSGLLA